MNQENENWWEEFYDGYLADVLLENADDAEAEKTVEFLKRGLEISPGDLVFDQCCGTGRVSAPLAKAGYRVIGIDLIESYVEAARSKAPNADFAAADAFEYTTPERCAGALNWWTSFGYAREDTANIRMLKRAFESIVPGAKFALDFMNVPGVLRNFQSQLVTRGRSETEGEIVLIRESEIDVVNGVLEKDWTYYLESGKRVKHHTSVRLYHPLDLKRLFQSAGFKDIEFFGDLDASPINIDSPRCIVVGTKP